MGAIKNAILKAKIEGIIYEIMMKTGAANVYVDETTTLSAKLAEIVTDVGTKASKTELTEGLSTRAASSHTHAQSDITGLTNALAERPTTTAMNTAISTAISNLINGAPETYDTLKEIADYISSHQDVVDSLNAAIGGKADKATTLAGYGITDGMTASAITQAISDALDSAKTYADGLQEVIDELRASQRFDVPFASTSTDGVTYTVTVPGIESLVVGYSFVMVPDTISTNINTWLNVNNLGAKRLRIKGGGHTGLTVSPSEANWLAPNKPVRVTYDGLWWVADLYL